MTVFPFVISGKCPNFELNLLLKNCPRMKMIGVNSHFCSCCKEAFFRAGAPA